MVHISFPQDAAVHIASKFGHLEIMNLLLKEGADIYNENTKNATAMTTALKDKHTWVASFNVFMFFIFPLK